MKDSSTLPDLCVLPTEKLLPHEDSDPRRVQKLSQRMLEDGILKNPPIVAAIPNNDRYVVLDGANRSSAFAYVGIPHIVAQLVSYDAPDVLVDTWYHVVSGLALSEFERSLVAAGDLQLSACSLEEARRALAAQEAIAYIVCESGVRKVSASGGKSISPLHLLNEVVGIYRGRADIYRASNDIWEIQKPYYPEITALIIFPSLKPEDVFEAALGPYKIPSGITRHIISARALNINFPITVLMSSWSFTRKKEWLQEWLMQRMSANAIRYYAESTFSFNE